MTHRTPEVFKHPPKKPSFLQGLNSVIIWSSLSFMLVLVLLPMIWMVMTALKQEGRAFDLTFIPSTVLTYPETGDGIPLAKVGANEYFIHVEIEDAQSAASVDVQIQEGSGITNTYKLHSTGLDLWTATIGPLSRQVAVGIETDGQPASNLLDDELAPEEFLPLELDPGVNFINGERLAVWLRSEELFGRCNVEGFEPASVVIGDRKFEWSLLQDGVLFSGAPENATYRIQSNRSFTEALGSLYTINNFVTILSKEEFNFGRYFINSLIVATSAALLTVFLVTLAGYAFAQKEFHYRNGLFYLLLSSMLVPGMIYMVPQFSITLKLGWLNSYTGMVVPHVANVFGLFLLRQYIEQIPNDLFRAAEIDGANDRQIFTNIVIPMTMPVMVTLFLLVFVGQWSNFLWQLIVNTGDQSTMTLPVGLQQFRGQNATDWELIMAGACFSILPITVIFLSLQRYFIMGLTAGSVKE